MSRSIARHSLFSSATPCELRILFLAPLTVPNTNASIWRSGFSTSAELCARHKTYKKRRDGNPNRGESALRRTGLRFSVGMSKEPLPQPVLDPSRRSKIQVDPNHGLWGFFNREKQSLTKPEDDHAHGMYNEFGRLAVPANNDQAVRGQSRSSDISHGRISILYGIFAVRREIDWRRKRVNGHGYSYALDKSKQQKGRWW